MHAQSPSIPGLSFCTKELFQELSHMEHKLKPSPGLRGGGHSPGVALPLHSTPLKPSQQEHSWSECTLLESIEHLFLRAEGALLALSQ